MRTIIKKGFEKILLAILLSAACIVAFTGCQLQKINAEPADTEKQMDIIKLKQGDYDMNLLTELFLGMSSDKAKKYNIAKYDGYYQYQADGMELILAPVDERYLDEIQSVSFFDYNANAGPAYETIVYSTETQGTFTRYYQVSLREYFPEENLETCSKEEAVSYISLAFSGGPFDIYAMVAMCPTLSMYTGNEDAVWLDYLWAITLSFLIICLCGYLFYLRLKRRMRDGDI